MQILRDILWIALITFSWVTLFFVMLQLSLWLEICIPYMQYFVLDAIVTSEKCHGVPNQRQHDCLFSSFSRLTANSLNLRITSLLWGDFTAHRRIPLTEDQQLGYLSWRRFERCNEYDVGQWPLLHTAWNRDMCPCWYYKSLFSPQIHALVVIEPGQLYRPADVPCCIDLIRLETLSVGWLCIQLK